MSEGNKMVNTIDTLETEDNNTNLEKEKIFYANKR